MEHLGIQIISGLIIFVGTLGLTAYFLYYVVDSLHGMGNGDREE